MRFQTLLVPVFLASQCSAFYIHASPIINRWAPAAVDNRKRDSCWHQPSSSRATLRRLAATAERYDEQWNTMYERLKEYHSINGDCCVPTKYPPDPQLGHWVMNLRSNYQNLSEERRQRLEYIGFVLRPPRKEWGLKFQRLVDYQLKHGHCRVPAKYPPDPQLGRWVKNQRANYQNLSLEWRQRLDDIGFVPGMPVTERWDSMFQRLRDYQSVNGHCAVPAKYSLDPQLGYWVVNQRTRYQNLSEKQRQRLDDIGFVVRLRTRTEWDLMFQRLVDFQLKHGDCRVPKIYQPDRQLGHWVMNQRAEYQNLSEERRQRLDDIGFVARLRKRKTKATGTPRSNG
jgi:Helicase associated domain